MKTKFLFLLLFGLVKLSFGQQVITEDITIVNTTETSKPLTTLNEKSPLKAALYSAVIPGGGQLYNKRWIKAPIAIGLVATGIGFTSYYNGLHNKYRNAFLAELEGRPHKYSGILNAEQLGVYQDQYKRYRDYSVALTLLAYALNIIDATVDAHLFNVKNEADFAIMPTVIYDNITYQPVLGLNLNLKF